MNLKLRVGDSVAGHSSEFQNLVNQLSNVGLKFDDELQALLLLSSLPDNWETLVVSLSNSAPEGKLTMAMVKDAVFNEEARRREMGTEQADDTRALISDGNRGRNQGKGNGRKGGRNRSKSRGHSFTCYHCQEEGHIKRNCPRFKAGKERIPPKEAALTFQDSDNDELALAVFDATDAGKSDWVLDSGCSYHICRDRSQFWEYEACDGGLVRMANGSANRVVGKGTVKFRVPSGKTVKVAGVRHVPGVKKNLISLGMLDERGCSFSADSGVLRVSVGKRDILLGKKFGGLYRLAGSVVTGGAAVRHGASGIGRLFGQEKRHLLTRTRREHGCSRVVRDSGLKEKQWVRVVHEKAQRKETDILGAPTKPKGVSFALDMLDGSGLSGFVDTGGGTLSPRTPSQ